ncbi:MAG: guanylate kinase [Longimicrobiales bacterium]|nr:guanylate kinase [Longimicrobiales bacterium]
MTQRAAPVVLAAASGTGKTTLARRLVGDSDRYVFSVSATTRSPRTGEVDGVDYHFLDIGDFEKRAEDGELVEWASVHGRLYGTPRAEIDDAARRGEHVVLDIDVQGARQIRASIEDAVLIFVLPPSVDIMMARLKGRGTEGREDIARRLRSALTELQALKDFDYVVVNDDLDKCIAEIRSITEGRGEVPDSPEQNAEHFRTEIVRILRDEYDKN